MNPITDIVFSLTWVLLLVWAIRTMTRGWNQVNNLNSPSGMWTTKVTRPMHPEMTDVEPGEELMGVTFDSPSCNLEEYKELQERIAELRSELEGDDDEDDDDGDVVVRV